MSVGGQPPTAMIMNTEQRRDVRGALINVGFARYFAAGDEVKEQVIHAVMEVTGERRKGCYTELFKHADGTTVSVTWAEKSHLPARNC